MAANYKLNIPAPAPKGSEAFASALKVCLATAAYEVPLQFARAPAEKQASLEVPKENRTLIDSNAIVRYFAATGRKPWSRPGAEALKQFELVEYEETVLSAAVRKGPEEALKLAEDFVAKANLPEDSPPSPATIVIFSTLYHLASTASPDAYPALTAWFVKSTTNKWVKAGVESAAAQTAGKPVKANKGAPSVQETPKRDMVKKLREGTAMKIPQAGEKILPIPGQRNILITSALPYVNNVPHLGNIVGSVLSADAYSRFCKARNYNTLFICGTDEYGTATETKAIEEGVTPQELCNKYHAVHSAVYKWFDIGFDHFGRTTTQAQTEIAQDIFLKLNANNFLIEEAMTQLFCEEHGFLADRFVEGTCPNCSYEDARGDQCDSCGKLIDPLDLIKPRCKLNREHVLVQRDSKHCFLDLEKLQPEIEKWARESSEVGQWSRNGRIITENWLREGLKKRCITRDLKWGVPVPLEDYKNKVLYVWFDACIGYVSITANYTKDWEKWWKAKDDVKLYQFMGKDNVPFHTVVFPGSQLGTREPWTMLHHISTTEYLQYEGGKFSKSRGVGVFGNNAQDTGVPPSVWRYYLLSSRPETGDTQFVWKDFVTKNNSELLNNLGNFVNRLIKFVNAKYEGVVPDYTAGINDPSFEEYKTSVNDLLASYVDELEKVHIRGGLDKVMLISAEGNRFLQSNKLDNNLLANNPAKAAAVIGFGLNLVYLVSALVYPYMPETAISIADQLNAPLRSIPDKWEIGDILPGHVIGQAEYLFSRIPEKDEKEWRERYGGKQEALVQEDKKKEKKKGKQGAKQQQVKKDQVPGTEQNQAGGTATTVIEARKAKEKN